ncbi:unnamed protein product, partial [marine sediment metagenome]
AKDLSDSPFLLKIKLILNVGTDIGSSRKKWIKTRDFWQESGE